MSEYIYGWDSVNKKKTYMGKYPSANPRGTGYYGRNDAGNPREANPNNVNPLKREFVGSGDYEFVFYSESRGLLTISANSFEDAWRIAKLRGYSRRDYRGK